MTTVTHPDGQQERLFVADFCPRLGAYLAERHASGYDAVAAPARFLLWLATHVGEGGEGDHPAPDPLREYLARTGRIPELSAEEETALAVRIEAGRDAERRLAEVGDVLTGGERGGLEQVAVDGVLARNQLQEANVRLVVAVAKRYTDRGIHFLDLVQEGNKGLVRAIEKYDRTKGYRFATYATWWIRQAITRAVAGRTRAIRLRPDEVAGIGKLARTERQMLQDLGRLPTPEELAAELGMT
jgi:RNA polymerase primary sigma factor